MKAAFSTKEDPMKEKEQFFCPLCQEGGERIPMKPGVYEKKVGRRRYFVVRGGLVCPKNPLHYLPESRYRLYLEGKISWQRLLGEMRDERNSRLTEKLLQYFGRKRQKRPS